MKCDKKLKTIFICISKERFCLTTKYFLHLFSNTKIKCNGDI